MSQNDCYQVKATVWLYEGTGSGSWHFATLSEAVSDEIDARTTGIKRGFGSVPVIATIGRTTWRTSIFPDAKAGAFIIPLKAEVRKKEAIDAGSVVTISIEITD